MSRIFVNLLVLLTVSSTCYCQSNPVLSIDKTLIKLGMMFRHGNRSPHVVIDGVTQEGAQLTTTGMRRMFDLGYFVRKRYGSFLTDDASEVKAQSIALNRCINSMQCFLTAAYPPTNKTMIIPGLLWQPIPVLMKELMSDRILYTESYCPRASGEWTDMLNTPQAKAVNENEENIKLFKYISKMTGVETKNFIQASFLQDKIMVLKMNNLPLPEWVTDDIYNKLVEFTDLWFWLRSADPVVQRLRAGPFINELIEVLSMDENQEIKTNTQADEDDAPHKFFVYAAKRFSLAILLQALDAYNNRTPDPGASLFFELHEWNNHRYLRVYYKNDSQTEVMHPLVVRGCNSFDCLWEDFIEAVKPFIPEDMDKECLSENFDQQYSSSETTIFPPYFITLISLWYSLCSVLKFNLDSFTSLLL